MLAGLRSLFEAAAASGSSGAQPTGAVLGPLAIITTFIPPAPPISEDEYGVHLVNFYLEDEFNYVAQYQAQPWTPVVLADEDGIPALAMDEEQSGPYFIPSNAWMGLPLPQLPAFADDDRPTFVVTTINVDEEQSYTQPVQNIPWNAPKSFADDNESVPFIRVDEEQSGTPLVQVTIWNAPKVFADDNEVVVFQQLDDEIQFKPDTVRIPWNPVVFSDDSEVAIFRLVDDTPWVAQVTVIAWNAPKVFSDDSEVAVRVVDDDALWIPQVTTITWNAPQVFGGADDFFTTTIVVVGWFTFRESPPLGNRFIESETNVFTEFYGNIFIEPGHSRKFLEYEANLFQGSGP